MKISVNLINKYLKNKLSTEKLAEIIERTEVEVEEILYSKSLDEKIVTAKVIEVSKHPNADKLNKAKVDNGLQVIDIVCGAPNIKEGLIVALAQVGSILPDGFEIGEAKIRGEISHGMLCSEKELGWGENHDGIVELDPSLPIGQSLCDIANISDTIDIKTPSNRWDYLSYLGLSREIAACDDQNELLMPEVEEIEFKNREVAKYKKDNNCKAFYSVKASVKANIKSPKWLVDNLQASGIRTINPVVDITNFVMLEYGQPSHAYDLSKLQGPIGVRMANKNEKFTALDGKNIGLTDSDLVIVDNSGPIALAGVIGGISTETDDSTTEVLIEIANFDKTVIRRSALRHGIRTEASARFEKGLPLTLPSLAAKRIIKLLIEICDAKISDVNAQLQSPSPVHNLGLRLRKAEKFIGYKLEEKEVVTSLFNRGFEPKHFSLTKELLSIKDKKDSTIENAAHEIYQKAGINIGNKARQQLKSGMEVPAIGLKPGDLLFTKTPKEYNLAGIYAGKKGILVIDDKTKETKFIPETKITKSKEYFGGRRYIENFNHIITVTVPWWRDDVIAEVDLFEEIAKTQGYNSMPETLPNIGPTNTAHHQLLPDFTELKEKLAALGLMEVMTYSFISKEDIVYTKSDYDLHLQIENPLSTEQDYLRTNLLPSHLRAASNNIKQRHSAMFEISRVYKKTNKNADEKWVLGFTVWGQDSLLRMKGIIDNLFDWYKIEPKISRKDDSDIYLAGRSALIEGLAEFGQVKDDIAACYGIKSEVSFAEIEIAKVINSRSQIISKPLLPYQIVYKDITIEVSNTNLYTDIAGEIKDFCYSIDFVDEFINDDLNKKNKKRLTIRIGLDMGPNPKSEDIKELLLKCSKKLESSQKAKVL